MSRETLLDEAIAKAKECGDWQLVEWLRMARGSESAARWYTGKFAELQAENDLLVMKLNAEHIVRQNLAVENAKLRELVRDMHRAICGLVVLGDDYAGEYEDRLCALDDRMNELGVDA